MQSAEWLKIKEIFYQTLDLPAKERERFLANQDDFVRSEVGALIASHEKAEDFIVEPAVAEFGLNGKPLIGKTIGGYKILEAVGAGGMGTVFLAEKEGLEKKIALKIIKRGMDTDAILRRFIQERQILSRLEHTNIARLLDGGTTDDGLPFFVMEYVEGLPVTKFCDEHNFDIKERLELFRQICTAVAYSHQNLIIHRDLKPSNILITKDGTPKLLDFGIAKLLNLDGFENTATATQGRIFTPEYASPEHLNGLPITTASDVYSLGVVLYELLSGQRPFQTKSRNYHEIANAVLTEEPVRPSDCGIWISDFGFKKSLNDTDQKAHPITGKTNPKSLKGDLDNIILKSLRKEPERRYQSVPEFTEDIRRYLVGLPVTATADSTAYRFKKFVSRHQLGTIFAALLLLLSGFAIWQGIVANREREKAEKRFNQVRKLANLMLFEYHDGIERLPGSTSVCEKMIKDALEYLDNLSAESGGDAALQSELAAAFKKVGDIQGNPYQSNLGDMNGALASYQKALSILEDLVRKNSPKSTERRSLANTYSAIADVFWAKGANAEALENYKKALDIDQSLADENPSGNSNQYALQKRYYHIGQTFRQMGDAAGALENYRKSLDINQKLFSAEPTKNDYAFALATGYAKIGDVLNDTEQYSEALQNHQKAAEIVESLTKNKNDITNQRAFALFLNRIALDKKGLGDLNGAIEVSSKALSIQKQLVEIDPQNEQYRSDIVDSYRTLGDLFIKINKLNEAIDNLEKGIAICRDSLSKSPDNQQNRQLLAVSYKSLGDALSKSGRTNEAQEAYKKGNE